MKAPRVFTHVLRPVGVRGIKYRSKAEANYAAYLEWLRSCGVISAWDYEPKTFWFTPDAVGKAGKRRGVRRGVVSYKPDFRVYERGAVEYHEVKGYLDDRSRVALDRMRRYYPTVRVAVIDMRMMAALRRQVASIVSGWIP